MKLIAITSPQVIDSDALLIKGLCEKGIDFVHLRKPDADISQCRKILAELPESICSRIIIHDFPELYYEFDLKGIHVNKNVTSLPSDYTGFKTRSCHSLDEIIAHRNNFNYLFLSPIFDSISKAGYSSAFSHDVLLQAAHDGIIDKRVIALGGVSLDKLPYLKSLNFGGAAMIGAIYNTQALNSINDFNYYR